MFAKIFPDRVWPDCQTDFLAQVDKFSCKQKEESFEQLFPESWRMSTGTVPSVSLFVKRGVPSLVFLVDGFSPELRLRFPSKPSPSSQVCNISVCIIAAVTKSKLSSVENMTAPLRLRFFSLIFCCEFRSRYSEE